MKDFDNKKVKDKQKFFAMIDRTRYIQRWSLMRNNEQENVAEHSMQTAIFAHALAIIREQRFPDAKQVKANDVLAKALFHDVSEVITGDLPTPVKYHDDEIKRSYKKLEALAVEDLLKMLPENMRSIYQVLLIEKELDELSADAEEVIIAKLIKAADKLSAYVKCIIEVGQGNNEFKEALESTREKLIILGDDLPELLVFMDEFIPAFYLSLDELKSNDLENFVGELE